MRKQFLPLLLITAAILANATVASGESVSKPAGSRPNIIVVMPDDIGYGDIASLGNPVVQTPNIDSLKRESPSRPTRDDRASVTSARWTVPIPPEPSSEISV